MPPREHRASQGILIMPFAATARTRPDRDAQRCVPGGETMNRRSSIVVAAVLLMLGMPGLARPVAAAPAQPIDRSGCHDPYENLGDIYQTCFDEKGVVQFTELPSGGFKSTINTTVSVTTTVNGEVSQADRAKLHIFELVKDGETHVRRYRSYTLDDILIDPGTGEVMTCIATYHYVEANGEVRVETDSFECV
jgi:hypothetical protein